MSATFDTDNFMAFSHCIALHTRVHLSDLELLTSISTESSFCFITPHLKESKEKKGNPLELPAYV